MSTHVPASLNSPSRMKLNVVELSERSADESFKKLAFKALGDLSDYVVLGADVLVATYVKPRKTAGGIILSDSGVTEDRWQSKVGLVLAMGPTAFKYDGGFAYEGPTPKIGEYIAFHTSDTREIGINGVSCRTIPSTLVRMIIPEHAADRLY